MDFSRRAFLGGAAAFGASGLLAVPPTAIERKPKLRFGVVSDVHVQCDVDPASRKGVWRSDNGWLEKSLVWFRERDVDAVVIPGDLADEGLGEQLLAVAAAWYRVFPNDRRPDGQKVEKVFVYGNHDWEGWEYNGLAARRFPDEAERKRDILRLDYAGWWERVFHEPYEPIYMKEVNGYRFIGSHWDGRDAGGNPRNGYARLKPFLAANAKVFDPARPFFYIQHPHLANTCYGPWAGKSDAGWATVALSAFPNAVAISGHSHYTLADERAIWQGAFTSVGASSLRYPGIPFAERSPIGYENTRGDRTAWRANAEKVTQDYAIGDATGGDVYGESRQGMLWDVFDDEIVIRRRDFVSGLDMGADWVVPLPTAGQKPFIFDECARKTRPPQFAKDAQLTVRLVDARTRGGKSPDGKEAVAPDACKAFEVSIPAVLPDAAARVKCYEVVAENDGKKISDFVLAEGFHLPPGHKRTRIPTVCRFRTDRFGTGDVQFTVTPIGWFDGRGRSISVLLRWEGQA